MEVRGRVWDSRRTQADSTLHLWPCACCSSSVLGMEMTQSSTGQRRRPRVWQNGFDRWRSFHDISLLSRRKRCGIFTWRCLPRNYIYIYVYTCHVASHVVYVQRSINSRGEACFQAASCEQPRFLKSYTVLAELGLEKMRWCIKPRFHATWCRYPEIL